MAIPQRKQDQTYTYADYLSWGEDERIEILDGEAIMMAPPSRKHQKISISIASQIHYYLKGKKCEVYTAPFAVRLFETDNDSPDNITTIVEPDISVICDMNKLDDKGCKGAPDMVIEILSPSTAKYDFFSKLAKYQQAGVREYWIVDPKDELIYTCYLENGHYDTPDVYSVPDIVKIKVLDACTIDLTEVFAD